MKRLIGSIVAVLLMTACGDSPTAPTNSDVNVSGTWTEVSPQPLRMTLAQSGNNVTGTFTIVASGRTYAGTVSGFSSGKNLTLTFTPSDPRNCGLSFTMMVVSRDRMEGRFVTTNCRTSEGGTTTYTR